MTQWFSDSSQYADLLDGIQTYVGQLSKGRIPAGYFTPHDSSHCQAVEKTIKALVNKSKIKLTELERFILFAAAWTHDIGMLETVAKRFLGDDYSPERMREDHDTISAWFLNEDERFRDMMVEEKRVSEDLLRSYVHTINIISKYHRRKYCLSDCPEARFIKGETVSARLLACLLRMGDTLHVDSSRYDRMLYNILQIGNFDRTARLHWLKSYVVSAIHLDIRKQTIFVTVDLPETDGPREAKLMENAKRLEFMIRESIYEDILAVADTFRDNDLPFYGLVTVDIQYCPGYQLAMTQDVLDILGDLDILLSPNTSKVIEKALDSISSLATMGFDSYEAFYNQTRQLIRHLDVVSEKRPCHVGLRRIIEAVRDTFDSDFEHDDLRGTDASRIVPLQERIKQEVDTIVAQRRLAEGLINGVAREKLGQISNVFLFGYSEMVTGFLCANDSPGFREKVNLYVLDCTGKRRLSSANSIEYDDAIHYATHLADQGFRRIAIMPETSFASLLSNVDRLQLDIKAENSVLLLGANGIDDFDGSCGHTSGHLLMAIVAREHRIPVKVVADEFKRGVMD